MVDNTVLPTNKDYEKGLYTRYYIKTKGSKNIAEVTEEVFGLLGSKIDDNLYVGFEFDWKLIGPLNDIFVDGIRQQAGVSDTNQKNTTEIRTRVYWYYQKNYKILHNSTEIFSSTDFRH